MKQVWGRTTLIVLLIGSGVVCRAAEKSTSKSQGKKGRSSTQVASSLGTAGRLPRFFASLVDDQQRMEIYEIQTSYRPRFQKLEKQLAQLEAAEMRDMEKVLSTSQRKKLLAMRNDANHLAVKKTSASKSTKESKSTKGGKSTKNGKSTRDTNAASSKRRSSTKSTPSSSAGRKAKSSKKSTSNNRSRSKSKKKT